MKPHPSTHSGLHHPQPKQLHFLQQRQLSCASKLRQFSERCPLQTHGNFNKKHFQQHLQTHSDQLLMKVSHAKTNISAWVYVLQIYIDGLKFKIRNLHYFTSLLLGLDTKGYHFCCSKTIRAVGVGSFIPPNPPGSGGFSGTAAHGPGLDSKLQAMRLEHSSVVQSWHILRKLRSDR